MTIDEMKARKRELGYSAEKLAGLAGIPVSTVRKIFSGVTEAPRRSTIVALEKVLAKKQGDYRISDYEKRRPGYHVELIDGKFYAQYGSELSQEDVDTMLAEESASAYRAYENLIGDAPKTMKDYEAMPEGWRGELIGGVIYDLAAPTMNHQRIVREITFQLENFKKRGNHDCEVLPGVALRLTEDVDEEFIPDIVVICDKSKDKVTHVLGAPDLIVEVLSPSTVSIDKVLKLNRYMLCGVKEYWIVDGDNRKVSVFAEERARACKEYSFDDRIPVGISEGKLTVDLSKL